MSNKKEINDIEDLIVEMHKKEGRNMSNFLLAMNSNEILYKYLAILMIYKSVFVWYNNKAVERMGQ